MILLRLIGGLGNQMSQVAYASILARKYNQPLYIDNSSYKYYKIRPCSIQKFKLNDDIKFYQGETPFTYKKMRISQKIYHVLQYIFGKKKQLGINWFLFFSKRGHYYSFDSDYYGYPITHSKNIDIYGYFLAEKYFSEEKNYLKSLFILKDEYIGKDVKEYYKSIVKSSCPIAISIRLQDDYLKSKVYNVCTKRYFETAISIMKEKFDNAEFFIFADDIERAKNLGLDIRATYIENVNDVEGMYLLSHCTHFIISNSSFSWWGAYLGESDDKVIIAPDHWMNNNKDYSSKYYEGVIKVKC